MGFDPEVSCADWPDSDGTASDEVFFDPEVAEDEKHDNPRPKKVSKKPRARKSNRRGRMHWRKRNAIRMRVAPISSSRSNWRQHETVETPGVRVMDAFNRAVHGLNDLFEKG